MQLTCLLFFERDSMIMYRTRYYAIARPSVCPYVTLMAQSKTVEVRIMQFSAYNNPIPLVFAA